MGPDRLDRLLVEAGFFPTRSRAQDAIRRGCVMVDGARAGKAGRMVARGAEISVADPASPYVSRAALKLAAGLDAFGFDASGRSALDLGASTGGFTQVLLERGAAHVTAIDVGHGQMHESLASDPRVTLLEGLNARDLDARHLAGRPVEAIVCDVSFISLKLALPPALSLAAPGAFGIFLVKPQFEVGRGALGRDGVVRDAGLGEAAARGIAGWLDGREGWRVEGLVPSPIEGGDGNLEYLLGARRG